jgi:hypothetical protein
VSSVSLMSSVLMYSVLMSSVSPSVSARGLASYQGGDHAAPVLGVGFHLLFPDPPPQRLGGGVGSAFGQDLAGVVPGELAERDRGGAQVCPG